MIRVATAAALAVVLAGCAAGEGERSFAQDLGFGFGLGIAAGLRASLIEGGAGPLDPEAMAEAIGRGLARGAAEELQRRGEETETPQLPMPWVPPPPLYQPPSSFTH